MLSPSRRLPPTMNIHFRTCLLAILTAAGIGLFDPILATQADMIKHSGSRRSTCAARATKEVLPLQITTRRANDRVEASFSPGRAILKIHSPQGISQAVLKKTGQAWPAQVVVRLYLNGLERLQIAHRQGTIHAAVSSQNGQVRVWKDNQEETLLDPQHAAWLDIRMVNGEGKRVQTIPLTNGYFEFTIPSAILAQEENSLTLDWIDFYRN